MRAVRRARRVVERSREETSPESADSAADAPPDRVETPEERVLSVLRARDGVARQQAVCARADRSQSAVSRLLGRMEERGRVVRIRVGREKLVYLPCAAPDIGPDAERGRDRETGGL